MAKLVLGLGSSHSPQLSSPIEVWPDHAKRDRGKKDLLGPDGEFHDYDQMLAVADPSIRGELDPHVWQSKAKRVEEALEVLASRLASAHPDAVVVVGDDQEELLSSDDIVPAFALCTATRLVNIPRTGERLSRTSPGIRTALWAREGSAPEDYPVADGLSKYFASGLSERGFDIAQIRGQVDGRSLGHAFTFVRRRLGLPSHIPIVPLFVNTALPPTIPSASRCYELGKALGELVAGWHGCERIAIVASGGLSHYVVLREFDEMVLEAMRGEDFGSIREIPARFFRSGTAETLNWIVVFGVAEGLPMSLIDYVPGYRSRAGTGTGMAFALWDPGDRERRTQAGAGRDAFPMSKTTGDAAGHEFI